jgi:hypothetical protein
VSGQLHAPSAFPRVKEPPRYPLERRLGGPRAGLDDVERRKFLTLPGLELRSLGRPARSQSLYRLRYPVSLCVSILQLKIMWNKLFVFTRHRGESVSLDCIPLFGEPNCVGCVVWQCWCLHGAAGCLQVRMSCSSVVPVRSSRCCRRWGCKHLCVI